MEVRAAYRALLRTVSTVFRGDRSALASTRQQARQAFRSNEGERDAARIGAP